MTLNLPTSASIIDIGGGNSKLSEYLYKNSFVDLTVLDISNIALSKIKEKYSSSQINTITSNIIDAKFSKQYDLWHDRAAFHFLTKKEDQEKYAELLLNTLKDNGYFLISTFSKKGPLKCSGLEICQYDKDDLVAKFSSLKLIESGSEDHQTPFGTVQSFTYCLFKKG